jgi:peptide/nickel transport system substrate-binding protein
MKKSKWSLLAMLFALLLVLAACGDKQDEGTTPDPGDGGEVTEPKDGEDTEVEEGFSGDVTNEGTPIKGGTLMVAMEKDSPFQGIFSQALYEDAYDWELMVYASMGVFDNDGDGLLTNDGIASFEVNEETKVLTIKIREGIKWSDGEPLKIDDLIYPYYIIGHKDYTGVRYNSQLRNIVGIEEYHAGTTETISGITKVDDYTYTLALKEISPGLYSGGDGILTYAHPTHVMGSVPIAELVEHDSVRKNPLSLGAFVIDKVVPGESVQYKPNEHYWKGVPKLDGVIVKVVPPSSIAKALEAGEYDVTSSLGSGRYLEIKDLKNIDILAVPEYYYGYLGFKVGKWNTETLEVNTDMENSKVGDVKLRQAMGYALNVEEVAATFYNGLRERANAFIPPVFSSFHDASLKGYTYDPEKAIAILDEAGYKDVDGDGLRENPKGEKLQIKLATMSGDDIAEQIAVYWLQNFNEVGLDVVLTDGRTIEFNSFYDRVEADDPEIDIFMGAWGVGSNPSPSGIYSHDASYNFSRYTSPTLQEILTNIDSDKSFDAEYRASQFAAFEKEMFDNAPVIPTFYRLELTAVNKRVKYWNVDPKNTDWDFNQVELVSENGVK